MATDDFITPLSLSTAHILHSSCYPYSPESTSTHALLDEKQDPPVSRLSPSQSLHHISLPIPIPVTSECFTFVDSVTNNSASYWPIRLLGAGSFSKVFLATSTVSSNSLQPLPPPPAFDPSSPSSSLSPSPSPSPNLTHNTSPDDVIFDYTLEPVSPASSRFFALKLITYPDVQSSSTSCNSSRVLLTNNLKREIDILNSVSHACLVRLIKYQFDTSQDRAFLLLPYYQGGDLFQLASNHFELLTEPLVRRIFVELVDVVRYLHREQIVHRDIKLENILLNYSHLQLPLHSVLSHPTPIITLTDLGLSCRIPQQPNEPYLMTRCGSDDYVAPEILLGQKYDGRLTDAWACGVVLYVLLEGLLPFDAPLQRPTFTKPSYRIACCDWGWIRFGDKSGSWNETAAPDELTWRGARDAIQSLLRKLSQNRLSLDQVAQQPWLTELAEHVETMTRSTNLSIAGSVKE